MTSIRDVAASVGVSTATVSRALRGLPRVSEGTRARVLAAARDLDYVASPNAAGLASGRTRTVGVVVPWVTRWFFASVVQGAQERLREQDYDLLLHNLDGRADVRERVFAGQLARRVDAVLVLSVNLSAAEQDRLRSLGRPVALVGLALPGLPGVRIDDVAAAVTATEHLLALGHRRVAHVGGATTDEHWFTAPVDRRRGYRETLGRAGLAVPEGYDVPGDYTVTGGADAARRLLGLPERPTALFCDSDEMAFGAVQAARQAGLRVPEDVSVIGIDDHAMAGLLDLTTVAQPARRQGQVAAEMLLHALAGTGPPVGRHARTLGTRLVVRGTTGPPARAG